MKENLENGIKHLIHILQSNLSVLGNRDDFMDEKGVSSFLYNYVKYKFDVIMYYQVKYRSEVLLW